MRSINKKGQGLPLNTIIIAIIVLVVLVVLVAIYVTQSGKFVGDINRQPPAELVAARTTYGACHPVASTENDFVSRLTDARKNNDPNEEAAAKSWLQEQVATCNTKLAAECSDGCTTTASS